MESVQNSNPAAAGSRAKKMSLMNFIIDMCNHHSDNVCYGSEGVRYISCACSICQNDLIRWIENNPQNQVFEFKCLNTSKFRNEKEDFTLFREYRIQVATAEVKTDKQLKGNFKAAVKKSCPEKLLKIEDKDIPEELRKRVKRYQFVNRLIIDPVVQTSAVFVQNCSIEFQQKTLSRSTEVLATGNVLQTELQSSQVENVTMATVFSGSTMHAGHSFDDINNSLTDFVGSTGEMISNCGAPEVASDNAQSQFSSYATGGITTTENRPNQTCWVPSQSNGVPLPQDLMPRNGSETTAQANLWVNGYLNPTMTATSAENSKSVSLTNDTVRRSQTNFSNAMMESFSQHGIIDEPFEHGTHNENGIGQVSSAQNGTTIAVYQQDHFVPDSSNTVISQMPLFQTVQEYRNQQTEGAEETTTHFGHQNVEMGSSESLATAQMGTDQSADEESDFEWPDITDITGVTNRGNMTSETQCNPSNSQMPNDNPINQPYLSIYPLPNRPMIPVGTLSGENRRDLQMVNDYDLARFLRYGEIEVRKIEFKVHARRGYSKVSKQVQYREVNGDWGGFKVMPVPYRDGKVLDTSNVSLFGPKSIEDGGRVLRELKKIALKFDNCWSDSNVIIRKVLETFETGALVFWWEQYQVDMQVAELLGVPQEMVQPLFSRLYCRRRCIGYPNCRFDPNDAKSESKPYSVMSMRFLSPFEEEPNKLEEFKTPEDVLVFDLFQTLLKTLHKLRALDRTTNTPAYENLLKEACLNIGLMSRKKARSEGLHMRFEVRSCLVDKMLQEIASRRNIIDDTLSVITETTAEFADFHL
ncbi:uncharacterized protein LOC142339296 isoform X2 [Convolutriloba macropyga]